MKKICHIIMVCLMLLTFGANAQTMSTMGKDFWFSFAQGRIEAAVSVTITGIRACTGVVSNPNTGWSHSFTVPANGSVVISIDTATAYNTTSGIVKNKGLHLVTTDTVSVYACNFLATSFDATFVLPTESLRDDYIIQSIKTQVAEKPSEILVVAIEDSTIVDFYPTATSLGVPNSANPFSMVLNSGQSLQLKTIANGDYSGTRVKSRDCKPIAVFNAHLCAYVPDNSGTYCDHVFEQSLPIAYWGKEFVATMSLHHSGDYVKVTALEDNCVVWVNGDYLITLASRQSTSIPLTTSSCYIKTSSPATVYSYLMSKNLAGPDGDPSMILIPPIEQQLKEVVFVNYSYVGQLSHYHCLNVVTRTDNVNNVYFDNNSIANHFSIVPGNTTYSFARLNVNAGTHRLISTGNSGFLAHAYGVGDNESYGYAVGFSVKPIGNRLTVNGSEVSSFDTVRLCVHDSITAYAIGIDSINIDSWFLEDDQISTSRTLNTQINDVGIVRLSAIVAGDESCFSIADTLSVVLYINDVDTTDFDTLVCRNPFVWDGETITTAGLYVHEHENQHGCDSLLRLNIVFMSSTVTEELFEGCDSVVVNGVVYRVDTSIMDTLLTAEGCDSVIIVTCVVHPSYFVDEQYDLDEGDTLSWIDGGRYWSNEQHPNVVYRTVHGCDSIITLQLNIIPHAAPPPQDSSAIWIPSAFTPDEETNSLFKIESNDMVEMHVTIFTRWGLYVTEFDGLTEGWDGTYNGTKCKQETYVYLVEYRTKAMPLVVQKRVGTVILLR